MTLIEVETSSDIKKFLAFPRILYKNDKDFVSHLDSDIEKVFNPNENSLLKDGKAKRWLLYEGNKLVGKTAAFYHQEKNLYGIGFFDCIDSQEAANMLFNIATSWLKNAGASRVEAPINFGERDKYWGLLVEGFERPSYQENYNFPYYQNLFENYGFEKFLEQTTSEVNFNEFDPKRFKSHAEKLLSDADFSITHFKFSEFDKYINAFVEVYNKAWKQHEHYVPLDYGRVKKLFMSMKPILREDLMWFTFYKDSPVAFYISVIDVNQIFKHLNGRMNWLGKLKFLFYRHSVNIDRIRGIVFGVVPEFQNKGLYSGMLMKMYEVGRADKYLQSSELAWIGDFNPKMHALFRRVNARKTKLHYTYEKQL
jgi:hypothetical protein